MIIIIDWKLSGSKKTTPRAEGLLELKIRDLHIATLQSLPIHMRRTPGAVVHGKIIADIDCGSTYRL